MPKRRLCVSQSYSGTLISIVAFGFSRSLWWAVGARALCGVLNGNIGIVKSFVGEISTR
jgi:hypothetical protein